MKGFALHGKKESKHLSNDVLARFSFFPPVFLLLSMVMRRKNEGRKRSFLPRRAKKAIAPSLLTWVRAYSPFPVFGPFFFCEWGQSVWPSYIALFCTSNLLLDTSPPFYSTDSVAVFPLSSHIRWVEQRRRIWSRGKEKRPVLRRRNARCCYIAAVCEEDKE